jgi:hypothetical protein
MMCGEQNHLVFSTSFLLSGLLDCDVFLRFREFFGMPDKRQVMETLSAQGQKEMCN